MSIVGVPMFLAPIFGPVIGGALVGAASWRWIFFVNLPVGAVALALALWLLPSTLPRSRERLDTLGLGLLSGGIVLFLYGLAAIGSSGTVSDPTAPGAMVAGLAPVAGFGWHALRGSHPLIDMRLSTDRGFATAAAATLVLGVPLFGVMLLPLYFQIVRGQRPFQTGILLIPQGLGAAVANKALRLAAHLAIYRNHIDRRPTSAARATTGPSASRPTDAAAPDGRRTVDTRAARTRNRHVTSLDNLACRSVPSSPRARLPVCVVTCLLRPA